MLHFLHNQWICESSLRLCGPLHCSCLLFLFYLIPCQSLRSAVFDEIFLIFVLFTALYFIPHLLELLKLALVIFLLLQNEQILALKLHVERLLVIDREVRITQALLKLGDLLLQQG